MRKSLALLAALAAVATIASTAYAATHPSTPARVAAGAPPTVSITALANGKKYNTSKLTAPAGKEFLLVFKNLSTGKHNVSLENGELEYGATLTIGKGSTATIFTLKAGTYHFYSSVGKDETNGMSGTLTVK
jgi:plastocyanin